MRKIRKAKCYRENTELMGDGERGVGGGPHLGRDGPVKVHTA